MRQVTVTGTVPRPIDEVYDHLLDNRNDPTWCPLARDVELVDGEPGVGATYRYLQGQGPGQRPFEAWMRTTVAERPTRLEWDNADRGLGYHAVIELTDLGGRTRVRHTNRVQARSPVQQAVWFTVANAVLRVQLRNLRRELSQ